MLRRCCFNTYLLKMNLKIYWISPAIYVEHAYSLWILRGWFDIGSRMTNRVKSSAPQHALSMLNSSGYASQKMVKTMPTSQVLMRRIMLEIFRPCTEIETINQDFSILLKIKILQIYIKIELFLLISKVRPYNSDIKIYFGNLLNNFFGMI